MAQQDITLQPGDSITIRAVGKVGPGSDTGSGGSPDSGGSGGGSYPDTLNYALPWAWSTDYLHTSGFGPATTVIVGFMVPADAPNGQKARISGAELPPSGPQPRNACISTAPGSFSSPIESTTDNPSPLFWLEVGANVSPGVTYYFNITQAGGGASEMSIQLTITN